MCDVWISNSTVCEHIKSVCVCVCVCVCVYLLIRTVPHHDFNYLKLSDKVADLSIDDWSVVQQSGLDITHICRNNTVQITFRRIHNTQERTSFKLL